MAAHRRVLRAVLARRSARPGLHRRGLACSGLLPPLFTKWIIDDAIPQHSLHARLAQRRRDDRGGARSAASSASSRATSTRWSARGSCATSARALVAHLHRMPLSFFTGTKTGEIMNRVSNDVDNIDNVVTGTLVTIVTNVADDAHDRRDDLHPGLALALIVAAPSSRS